jgi:hypothetical protein
MKRSIARPRFLLAMVLVVPVSCFAATATWEAFDYKNCIHWSITSDFVSSEETHQRALKVWNRLSKPGAATEWGILQGSKLFEDGLNEYGVCNFQPEAITCSPDTEFPLAGATFTEQESNTFKCTKGCEKFMLNMLYQMGYGDGPDSKHWGKAARKFEAVCHEKQRKKKFFDRLDNSYSK